MGPVLVARRHSEDEEGAGSKTSSQQFNFLSHSSPQGYPFAFSAGFWEACRDLRWLQGSYPRMRRELDVVAHICRHSTEQAEREGGKFNVILSNTDK